MIFCSTVALISMYGEFQYYLLIEGCSKTFPPSSASIDFGPRALLRWMLGKGTRNIENALPRSFTEPYLIIWGARYLPSMLHGHQWFRWFSCIFVHHSPGHFFSNVLMLFVFGRPLERKHGSVKVLLIFFVSHLCGALASAAFENPMSIVFGASGAIYGLVGLFIADWFFSFPIVDRPSLELLIMFLSSIYLIMNIFQMRNGISQMSHIGGLVSGFTCALLRPRCPVNTDREWTISVLSGFALIVFFILGFSYVYLTVMPSITDVEIVQSDCS